MGYKYLTGLLFTALLSACGGGGHDTDEASSSSLASSSSSSSESSSSSVSQFELPVELGEQQAIIFYAREDDNYDGWGLHLWNDATCDALADAAVEGISWDNPMPATGVDDEYGAYFVLDLNQSPGEGACVNFIVHSGDNKALSENDLRMDLSRGAVVLTRHGLANLQYPQDNSGESPLPFTLTETQAAIFYHRPDGDYTGWGLHLWNGGSCTALADNAVNNITWDNPMAPSGIDSERGAYFILDLNQPGGCINFIVHSGDNKALAMPIWSWI